MCKGANMHPTLPPVFSHIESNQESYIQRLIDYVRHPSISAHDIGIREVSELLIKMVIVQKLVKKG